MHQDKFVANVNNLTVINLQLQLSSFSGTGNFED